MPKHNSSNYTSSRRTTKRKPVPARRRRSVKAARHQSNDINTICNNCSTSAVAVTEEYYCSNWHNETNQQPNIVHSQQAQPPQPQLIRVGGPQDQREELTNNNTISTNRSCSNKSHIAASNINYHNNSSSISYYQAIERGRTNCGDKTKSTSAIIANNNTNQLILLNNCNNYSVEDLQFNSSHCAANRKEQPAFNFANNSNKHIPSSTTYAAGLETVRPGHSSQVLQKLPAAAATTYIGATNNSSCHTLTKSTSQLTIVDDDIQVGSTTNYLTGGSSDQSNNNQHLNLNISQAAAGTDRIFDNSHRKNMTTLQNENLSRNNSINSGLNLNLNPITDLYTISKDASGYMTDSYYSVDGRHCSGKIDSANALLHHDYGITAMPQSRILVENQGKTNCSNNNYASNNSFLIHNTNSFSDLSNNSFLGNQLSSQNTVAYVVTYPPAPSITSQPFGAVDPIHVCPAVDESSSSGSCSDKENTISNCLNVAKMDSSYFSLSTDELSNQSSTSSGTGNSNVAASSINVNSNNLDRSSKCSMASDRDFDHGKIRYESGTSCSSMAYNESDGCSNENAMNDHYEVSEDVDSQSSSDFYSVLDQENRPPESSHSCFESKNVHYSGPVPLLDVTDKYTSSEIKQENASSSNSLVAQYILNQRRGSVTTTAASLDDDLTPMNTATHRPKSIQNANKVKYGYEQVSKQVMTPDTFAATRQLVADSPMTPTAYKLGNLNSNSIESLWCPIPELGWGDNRACWEDMITNDDIQFRLTRNSLLNHSKLTHQHRAVVLEWLSEVTCSYRMRKDTFYLAVNFFDRFLTATSGIGPDKIQLLGTSALFTASKMEEIYPPPSKEFANVTDGLCDVLEIIEIEICLVQQLGWKLNPMTAIQWLLLYLQLKLYSGNNERSIEAIHALSIGERITSNNLIVNPTFDPMFYHKVTVLLDLCIIAHHSTQYAPRILAAAAVLQYDHSYMSMFSCLDKHQLQSCYQWMKPFAIVANELFQLEPEFVTNKKFKNNIMLHQHIATMSALKKAEFLGMNDEDNLNGGANMFGGSAWDGDNTRSEDEVQYELETDDDDEEDEEKNYDGNDCGDELFSINPVDQINMVLLSPPYDNDSNSVNQKK